MGQSYPDIIPFDAWINSQLSIARHFGAITLGGKTYVVDYVFAEETKDGLCKPNLVEEKLHEKMKKENEEAVKAFKKAGEEAKKKAGDENSTLLF